MTKDDFEIYCTRLVSKESQEPILWRIFQEELGHWTSPGSDETSKEAAGQVVVTWLPDPGDWGYRMVIFCDVESGSTFVATCNYSRLQRLYGGRTGEAAPN